MNDDLNSKDLIYAGTLFKLANDIGYEYQDTIDLFDFLKTNNFTNTNYRKTLYCNVASNNIDKIINAPFELTRGFNLIIFQHFVGTGVFAIFIGLNGEVYFTYQFLNKWLNFENAKTNELVNDLKNQISNINNTINELEGIITPTWKIGALSIKFGDPYAVLSGSVRLISNLLFSNKDLVIINSSDKYLYRIQFYDNNDLCTEVVSAANTGYQYIIEANKSFALAVQLKSDPNQSLTTAENLAEINDHIKIYYKDKYDLLNDQDTNTINYLNTEIILNLNWSPGTFTQTVGQVSNESGNKIRMKTTYLTAQTDLYLTTDGIYKTALYIYDDNMILREIKLYDLSTKIIYKGQIYRIIICDAIDNTIEIDTLTNDEINSHIKIYNDNFDKVINKETYLKNNENAEEYGYNIKWIAMGDSITEKYYSAFNDGVGTMYTNSNVVWATLLANKNNWLLTNVAIGGTGYMHLRSQDTENMRGCNVAKAQDFTQYDLVTLAYGINDWKGNNVLGTFLDDITNVTVPTTVMQAMKMTIEEIYRQNPHIKVIVITPLYCHGYNNAYDNDDDYCLGHRYSNSGTLEEFVQEMIKVCEYYHIEYIDMTHYGPINRLNVIDLCPDGIHPSIGAHKLIAQELCKKINCG